MSTTNQLEASLRSPRVGQMALAAAAVTTALCFTPVTATWSGAPSSHAHSAPRTSFGEVTSSLPRGVAARPVEPVVVSNALRVAELRTMSNLTADQVGRLFGVSRRSVQNWIAGAPMTASHEERLTRLTSLVLNAGSTPEERRLKLLKSSNGVSLFHQLINDLEQDALVNPVAVSARNQLDA